MSVPEEKPIPAHSGQITPAERQARELAASLDTAADDLERNGPVPPAEVRRTLLALYAELGREKKAG
jgi:hypothetical protein